MGRGAEGTFVADTGTERPVYLRVMEALDTTLRTCTCARLLTRSRPLIWLGRPVLSLVVAALFQPAADAVGLMRITDDANCRERRSNSRTMNSICGVTRCACTLSPPSSIKLHMIPVMTVRPAKPSTTSLGQITTRNHARIRERNEAGS